MKAILENFHSIKKWDCVGSPICHIVHLAAHVFNLRITVHFVVSAVI